MGEPGKAPAGWYEDGTGSLRYWDGGAWTEHTSPRLDDAPVAASEWTVPGTPAPAERAAATASEPAGVLTPDTPAPAAQAVTTATADASPSNPRRPNALSITALVTAVIGFVFLYVPVLSIVGSVLVTGALVLAIISFALRGVEWSAIAAMAVSIIGIVLTIVSVILVATMTTVPETLNELDVATTEPTEEEAEPAPDPEAGGALPPIVRAASASVGFGETMFWDDGVGMSVSQPEPYVPTEFATGATLPTNVVFTLTITNGSDAAIDLLPYSEVSSGGQPTSIIFDFPPTGEEIGAAPTSVLEPGQSASWKEAWSVADPNAITMTNSPTLDHAQVTFTNVP